MIHTEQVLGNTGCLFAGGNCIPFYRLENKRWILLDSGSRHIRRELEVFLQQNQIHICAVLCSHAHFDHTENNRFLQETFGAKILMSALDAGMVNDTTALKSCFYSHTSEDIGESYREMLCRADEIFVPWQKILEVEGAVFTTISLPGHAASHMGFVTPDGAVYLADSVFNPDYSGKERLLYMLNWKQALETMEKIRRFSGKTKYILAHAGVYENIQMVAEENLHRFFRMLQGFYALFTEQGVSLDELIKKAALRYSFPAGDFERARLLERDVRAIAEYWAEMGKVERKILDGVVVYRRLEEET